MSSLRPTIGATRSPQARADELVDGVLGSPVFVDVVIPRTQVKGRMRLATRSERFEANAAARVALAGAGFPIDAAAIAALGAHEQWQYELGVRILAVAVRHPTNEDRALASLEDWRACDDDQIDAMWVEYQAHQARMNPLGADVDLTDAEASAIIVAAKKKDVDLLMSYGLPKLVQFAIISVEQPATSTTPPS